MANALSREAITKREGEVGDGDVIFDCEVGAAWLIGFPEIL